MTTLTQSKPKKIEPHRDSEGHIPRKDLWEALVKADGNASEVAKAYEVTRERIRQLINHYDLPIADLRETPSEQALGRSRTARWRVPTDLVKEIGGDLSTPFCAALLVELESIRRIHLHAQSPARTPGQKAGITLRKVRAALRLNDGAIAGAARDLRIAGLRYWIEKDKLWEDVARARSIPWVPCPWKIPGAVFDALDSVSRQLSVNHSRLFARAARGVLARWKTHPYAAEVKGTKAA